MQIHGSVCVFSKNHYSVIHMQKNGTVHSPLKHLALFKSWEQKNRRGVLLEPSFDLFLREVLLLLLGKLADMPESLDTSKVFQLMLLLKWSLSLRKTADLPYPGAEGCGTFHMVCVSLVL